jgi:hypothetical protein
MLPMELPRPPTFLRGNWKENKENRPDNQPSVVEEKASDYGSDRTCLSCNAQLAAFSGRGTPRHSPRSAVGFLTRLFA